jgi:ParB-like chromosome segregation protein Spo0J
MASTSISNAETHLLPLAHLERDPRNANVCDRDTLEKLQRNIARTGLCPPLIVRPNQDKPDSFILIDGHHRKLVLEQLGWESAPCQIWPVSDHEARIALATLNRLRGTDDIRKRASLIDSLVREIPALDLSALIPESPAEIADLLSILSLDDVALESTLKAQRQAELDTLPVPLTFLVTPENARLIEEALAPYLASDKAGQSIDRGLALATLCHEFLALKAAHEAVPEVVT